MGYLLRPDETFVTMCFIQSEIATASVYVYEEENDIHRNDEKEISANFIFYRERVER